MPRLTGHSCEITVDLPPLGKTRTHLCFKHARPKMCHSPKVENRVDNKFSSSSLIHIFLLKKKL